MSREATNRYRRTPKGILTNMYNKQIQRSKKKGIEPPSYTLTELHERFLGDSEYLNLCDKWLRNGCQYYDKPSIDRIDPDIGYTMDNIKMVTWRENREKGDKENAERITTAVVMYNSHGKKIDEFESVNAAVEKTKLNQSLIVMCCQGKRNHTGGFTFRYRGDKFRKRFQHPELLRSETNESTIQSG